MIKGNVIQNMSVDHQQIAPTIIIKIKKTRAKRAPQNVRLSESRSNREIGKSPVPIVAVQSVQLEVQMADKKIEQAVVHHVRGVRAHPRFRTTIFAESCVRFVSSVAKRAITIIEIQKVSLRIVCNENIRPAVSVQI